MGVDGIQPARRVLDDIVGMEVKHIHFSEQVVVEDEIPTEGPRRGIAQLVTRKPRSEFGPVRMNAADVRLRGDDEKATTLGVT
jgi:hypothetical protein